MYISGLGKYVTRALVCLLSPVFVLCGVLYMYTRHTLNNVSCIPIHIIIWIKCSMNITMISITFPTVVCAGEIFVREAFVCVRGIQLKLRDRGKCSWFSNFFVHAYKVRSYRYYRNMLKYSPGIFTDRTLKSKTAAFRYTHTHTPLVVNACSSRHING